MPEMDYCDSKTLNILAKITGFENFKENRDKKEFKRDWGEDAYNKHFNPILIYSVLVNKDYINTSEEDESLREFKQAFEEGKPYEDALKKAGLKEYL